MKTIFLRVIEAEDKAVALSNNIAPKTEFSTRFSVASESFGEIPRSPFAYWAKRPLQNIFTSFSPLEGELYTARRGPSTCDDFRYIRLTWELSSERCHPHGVWKFFSKGGSYSMFYFSFHLLVDWEPRRETFLGFLGRPGREISRPESVDTFFRPGLTWALRSIKGISFRIMPTGCIFGHKGPAVFSKSDDTISLLSLVAVTNSRIFGSLVELQMAFGSYEVGVIQRSPLPEITYKDYVILSTLAKKMWSNKRDLDTTNQTSHSFSLPALLQVDGDSLSACSVEWERHTEKVKMALENLQVEIDDHCYGLYGISGEERAEIERGFGDPVDAGMLSNEVEDNRAVTQNTTELVATLLSWALGVAFGRFDVRLATGDRAMPPEPEPFDPLPVCSPGMLTGKDGFPLSSPPEGYPIAYPEDGILVDDPGHARDLIEATRTVFEVAMTDGNERWHEAAELVGARNQDLRHWFSQTFFAAHIKRYSKSRRKAPIYWQLATPSTSYSVWIYIHRASRDTLFRVLEETVKPKRMHEENRLQRLQAGAGPNPTRTKRLELEAGSETVAELRAFEKEIALVAPLWNPDLDDGVIINFAPLWRLVPQHRAWQKECRQCWERLQAGDYDWAHLAMRLWPERVVPKCSEDRSLAIAHDLEAVFWVEDENGNWQPRKVSEARVQTLVGERTSTAIKAALDELLTAPAPSGARKRPRGRRPRTEARPPKAKPATTSRTADSETNVDEATLRLVREAVTAVAGGAAKADVLEATGLSEATWQKAITNLLAEGSITRTGQKQGTRYHPAGDEEAGT